MTRKKLPAYGAQLMKTRRVGTHPVCIHLIFGNDWRTLPVCSRVLFRGLHSMLALKPEDYAPGTFDFSVVTGVAVDLFDQVGAAADYDEVGARWGAFYSLVRELVEFAAPITLHSPRVWDKPVAADEFAFCVRRRGDGAANNGWPQWWSQEVNIKNEQRRVTWLLAAGERAELERV